MSAPSLDAMTERRWREVTGTDVPTALNGMLLEAALNYEIQCKDHGGLSLGDTKRLAQAGRAGCNGADATAPASKSKKGTGTSSSASSVSPSFAFGTQFVREWKGRDEIVTVVDGGFLWDGHVHASLSAAARAITGTRWNGPRFFGVETKRAKP